MTDSHQQRHAELAKDIRRHDQAYYVEAQPTVSDREYDQLYRELLDLEASHPELFSGCDAEGPKALAAPAPELQDQEHLRRRRRRQARLLRPRRRREEGEGAGAGHGGLGGRRGDAAARQGRRRPLVEQGHVPDDRPRRRRQDRLQGRARRHAAGEPPGEERDLRRGEEQDARDLRGGVPHEAEAGDDGRPLHAVAHARRRA